MTRKDFRLRISGMGEGELQSTIAGAIKTHGVAESCRRLGLKPEALLRLAVTGGNPHRGTIALALWCAARIFRVGILMYGKRSTLRELGRWVREG